MLISLLLLKSLPAVARISAIAGVPVVVGVIVAAVVAFAVADAFTGVAVWIWRPRCLRPPCYCYYGWRLLFASIFQLVLLLTSLLLLASVIKLT